MRAINRLAAHFTAARHPLNSAHPALEIRTDPSDGHPVAILRRPAPSIPTHAYEVIAATDLGVLPVAVREDRHEAEAFAHAYRIRTGRTVAVARIPFASALQID